MMKINDFTTGSSAKRVIEKYSQLTLSSYEGQVAEKIETGKVRYVGLNKNIFRHFLNVT